MLQDNPIPCTLSRGLRLSIQYFHLFSCPLRLSMKYFYPVRGLRLSIGFFTLLGGLDYQYIFFTLAPVLESKAFPFPPLGYKKAHPRHTVKGGFAAAVGGLTLDDLAGACYPANKWKKRGAVRSAPSSSLLALLSLLPFFDVPAPVVALPAFFFRAAALGQILAIPAPTGQALKLSFP